jgi:hypothetical protein
MRTVTRQRILAAAAVIVAATLVLLTRGRNATEVLVMPPDPARVPPVGQVAGAAALAEAQPAASSETPAGKKLRELGAMSETFRNTTFLIAIRDGGFVCNELLGAYGGVNNSTTWTVTCSEMLAYTVSVASTGALHVEPMLQHLDLIGPPVSPLEPGRQPLPPQRLPPQRR